MPLLTTKTTRTTMSQGRKKWVTLQPTKFYRGKLSLGFLTETQWSRWISCSQNLCSGHSVMFIRAGSGLQTWEASRMRYFSLARFSFGLWVLNRNWWGLSSGAHLKFIRGKKWSSLPSWSKMGKAYRQTLLGFKLWSSNLESTQTFRCPSSRLCLKNSHLFVRKETPGFRKASSESIE